MDIVLFIFWLLLSAWFRLINHPVMFVTLFLMFKEGFKLHNNLMRKKQ